MLDQMPSTSTSSQPDLLRSLVSDHRLSRCVLTAMEQAAVVERSGRPLQVGFWLLVLEYFEGYYDLVHHRVEDELLLPRLAREGFAVPGSAVRQMMQEHERMAPFRQHLRHALEQRVATELHATAQAFVALQRQHLALEEQHVFPLVRALLSPSAQSELASALDEHATAHAKDCENAEGLVVSIRRDLGNLPSIATGN